MSDIQVVLTVLDLLLRVPEAVLTVRNLLRRGQPVEEAITAVERSRGSQQLSLWS
jgi:hypothetical protein